MIKTNPPREERLAARLRENLLRRKNRARALAQYPNQVAPPEERADHG